MGGGFTRPSVHQRSEALKEPCDGLGVFKRGTQWATIQDSVGSASETGCPWRIVISGKTTGHVTLLRPKPRLMRPYVIPLNIADFKGIRAG